jgi:hypothetical protein
MDTGPSESSKLPPEYYDPRNSQGIGGHGFSWSAALTLAWLTDV